MTITNPRPPFLRRIAAIFPALRHRNYRLFVIGQGGSLIGTWMQGVALSWLVYRLTDSEFLLGFTLFMSRIFTFPIAPFAGVIADRTNRRTLLIAIQTAAMIQAFVLAVLTFTGAITVWQIIALSAVLGLIGALDIPVRQSFVVEMLEDRNDLPNAIALNSMLVNGAKLIGPPLAGFVVAITGEGICFLLNGLSYLAVIAALAGMKIPRAQKTSAARVLHNLAEGAAYAARYAPIRALLTLVALINLLGASTMTLLPVFAKDILGGGPHTFGFLMGASGVGAIIATLFLATRKTARHLHRLLVPGGIFVGVSTVGFALSGNLYLSMLLQAAIGFGTMTMMATCNTLIQTFVDDDKRGRVMGFYTMAFMGMMPFGSLLAGALAARLSTPWAVIIGGIGCAAASILFAIELVRSREAFRQAHERK